MPAGLELSILGPAFLAGLLVLITHVPLGRQVLQRGIIFIDLCIAQIAGIGVIAAHSLGWGEQWWAVQAAALSAALLGALVLSWTDKRWPETQEALIGVLFVLASCIGIVLLANSPHGGERLRDLLVGQVLWVSHSQLAALTGLTALLAGLWFGLGSRLGRSGFYLMFALAVTASVQLVGVYLVFACLILPALATRSLNKRLGLLLGYALGSMAFVLGLLLSALLDWPSGAAIVIVMSALAGLVAIVVGGLKPGLR